MLQSAHIDQRIGYRLLLASALLALIVVDSASAQTTTFTYQGKLADNGSPATSSYYMQFKLFDDAVTGTQQGPTLTKSAVEVVIDLHGVANMCGDIAKVRLPVRIAGMPLSRTSR